MNEHCSPRGGAPVGLIGDLDAAEALAVHCLRLWADGRTGRDTMSYAFMREFGAAAAEPAVRAFENLMELCVRYGRRPLMHHKITCRCLGADEACFVNFIMCAAEGEREDAMLLATLMVRPDVSPMLVDIGRDVGLNLRRIVMRSDVDRAPTDPPKTLH